MTDWTAEFKRLDALWLHSGDPAAPHALLTSGLHSDGFFNGTKVMQRPEAASRLLDSPDGLKSRLPARGTADWVIGSAMGAITLAYAVAERLDALAGFTEKDDGRMRLKRFALKKGSRVLIVEDVLTTGASTRKTIAGVKEALDGEVEFQPFILCLVNRSGGERLDSLEIRSLLQLRINSWPPEDCPLCRGGSKVVRPKEHWTELTAGAVG